MLNKEDTYELLSYLYSVGLLHDDDFKRLDYLSINKIIVLRVMRLYKNELEEKFVNEINRLSKGEDQSLPLDEMCYFEKSFEKEKEELIGRASNKFMKDANELAEKHVEDLNKFEDERNRKIKEEESGNDKTEEIIKKHKEIMKNFRKNKHLNK